MMRISEEKEKNTQGKWRGMKVMHISADYDDEFPKPNVNIVRYSPHKIMTELGERLTHKLAL